MDDKKLGTGGLGDLREAIFFVISTLKGITKRELALIKESFVEFRRK